MKYWYDYVNPNNESDDMVCYNVHGTVLYFSTQLVANRYSAQIKVALNTFSIYAKRTISNRIRNAMEKWNLSIYRQKEEMEQMLYEDFLSSTTPSIVDPQLFSSFVNE